MFVSKGTTLNYVVVGAAVLGGSMVIVGDLVGIAANNAEIGETVVVDVAGKFRLPKDAVAIANGKKCYLKDGTQLITSVVGSNKFIGYAATAVVSGDSTVDVILKQL